VSVGCVGVVSPSMLLQEQMQQVKLKGTVMNATTTLDGIIIILMDVDSNLIYIHTSSICVYIEQNG